ncbi:hypothetical protein EDB87DRAFT_375272 [Lactarius vividus]|nr:hypothetical protein EDB87DRAFT_375272 [Lactarius vividus]
MRCTDVLKVDRLALSHDYMCVLTSTLHGNRRLLYVILLDFIALPYPAPILSIHTHSICETLHLRLVIYGGSEVARYITIVFISILSAVTVYDRFATVTSPQGPSHGQDLPVHLEYMSNSEPSRIDQIWLCTDSEAVSIEESDGPFPPSLDCTP